MPQWAVFAGGVILGSIITFFGLVCMACASRD